MFRLGCIAQALWALLWLIGALSAWIVGRDARMLVLPAVMAVWFYAAASLIRGSRWRWCVCLAALLLLVGTGLLTSVLTVRAFWSNDPAMEAPNGALALIVDVFLLVPSALLAWHLVAFRSRLYPDGT